LTRRPGYLWGDAGHVGQVLMTLPKAIHHSRISPELAAALAALATLALVYFA
jgi:hypothetical protein